MPQFKIAKTKDINKIQNKPFTEDKLYIYKETDSFGRLFYDFEDGKRIEIGSLDNIYIYTNNNVLSNDIEVITTGDINKFNSDGTQSTITDDDIKDIKINSFISADKALYNIRSIDRKEKTLTIVKIYSHHNLVWNDYYEQ